MGLRLAQHSQPSLVQNTFAANETAIQADSDSSAFLKENTFDGNKQAIVGQALGASDKIGAVARDGKVPHQGGGLAEYRKLAAIVLSEKINEHPVVIYDLRRDLGHFGVTALFPWATFTLAASVEDTQIQRHEAFDLVTDKFKMDDWRRSILGKLDLLEDFYIIVSENFSISWKHRAEWAQIILFFILQGLWFFLIYLELRAMSGR